MRVRRLAAASLLVALLPVPARAAAPFAFTRRVIGGVTAPTERTYAVPPGALLAGVTWRSGDATVSVRRDGGAWEALDNEPGDGSGVPGTEPAWLGARLLTVRVVPRPSVSGVEVDFVGGGRAAAAPATRALPRLGSVVTRAGWGADESLRHGRVDYTAVAAVVVHHTVTPNDYSPEQAASYVRAVYAYHTRSRGWSDIGYNLLVDKYGTVYEGRYGDFARGVVGAHTAGFNASTLGVSLLGNFDTVQPPAALLDGVARVGGWAAERWHFDPRTSVTLTSRGSARFPSGARVIVPRLPGHRDLGQTACPGRYVYDVLPSLRAAAWHKLAAVYSTPVVTGAPVHAPNPVTITATLDHTARWAAQVEDPQGNVLAIARGSGTKVGVSWDGRLDSGLPAPPAVVPGTAYSFTLYADDQVHGPSDPARGTFDVGLPAFGQ